MNTKKIELKDRQYDIIGGPSKDALFDACKYAYCKNSSVQVKFSVAMGYTMPANDPGSAYVPLALKDVRIRAIEHEDSSGDKFILQGYCEADLGYFGFGEPKNFKPYRFKAFYNARRRIGWITFE